MNEEVREKLRDYVAYCLTSARGLYREPQNYGPMRLTDGLMLSIALLREAGIEDEKLNGVLGLIEENLWKAGDRDEEFAAVLDQAILELAKLTLDPEKR